MNCPRCNGLYSDGFCCTNCGQSVRDFAMGNQTGNKTAEHVATARTLGEAAKSGLENKNTLNNANLSSTKEVGTRGRATIQQHEGKKYLREIWSAQEERSLMIDVYSVIVAFGVTCPATAHAIKKLLCAGTRGKGDQKADLIGAIAAINRAIDLIE